MNKQHGFRWRNGGQAASPHVNALQQMQLVPVQQAEASDIGIADGINGELCSARGDGANDLSYAHAKCTTEARDKRSSTTRSTWRTWDEPENADRLQRMLPYFLCLAVMFIAGLVAAGVWIIRIAINAKGEVASSSGGD